MKIIFNHPLNDWYWQIYDELDKNHEIILPKNFRLKKLEYEPINLDALENVVDEHIDTDFIFDFKGDLFDLIKWNKKKKAIPLVVFITNVIGRTHKAKMSIFANVWYVNANATQFIERYNVNNLIYDGMAANPYIFYPLKTKKEYDVTFFGRFYGDRSYYLDEVSRFCLKNKINYYFPMGHGEKLPWSFEDINMLYNQTKINISFAQRDFVGKRLKRRVNLRTFEICMSGNFQLLQYTPCIEEYFEPDKDIVCWKNKKDLFNKILYYLENGDEREKIAKNGYKRAIENHTWTKRFETVGKLLKTKKSKIDFMKFVINISHIFNEDETIKIQKLIADNISKKVIKIILGLLGYKKIREIKNKKKIEIKLPDKLINYIPNLKDFIFIKMNGKILMVIKVISTKSKINSRDWKDLEKILYLTENYDLSLPQYGILTNGSNWLIRDFKKRRWLNKIPNRKELKNIFNTKHAFKRRYFFLKELYKKHRFEKFFIIKKLEMNFRLFVIKLRRLFY
ncbi:MAG: glycosyltransferase [Promethearchaeota archaeon]